MNPPKHLFDNKFSNPTTMRSIILSHTRSSSMPSRISHPLNPKFDRHLNTMNPDYLEPTSSSSSSSSLSSMAKKLHNLEGLYDCVEDLLLSPRTQQIFTRENREKWVDEILDRYLGLVDSCATAKDFVSQSKEHILSLLSAVRRKRDSVDLSGFISSRKAIKKQIRKSVRNMGGLKNKFDILATFKDRETIAVIGWLREIERVSLELFEALLLSVEGAKSYSKSSRWSLVSKVIHSRKVSYEECQKCSGFEFGDLDDALCKIVGLRALKGETGTRFEEFEQWLREMDLIVRVVEDILERLFKRLIRCRVSLLNMQSHL